MWYVFEDTIPANTTETNKRELSIKVSGGILHNIVVTIPPGSSNLVHLQLRKAGYYILPRHSNTNITGEHINVPYNDWIELKAAENVLTLQTWNEDETYSHTVRVLVGILPKQIANMSEDLLHDLRMFLRLFMRRP